MPPHNLPFRPQVLHCTGFKRPSHPLASHCLLLLCRPLPVQGVSDIPAGLNHRTFHSIHSPDMKFTSCDSRLVKLNVAKCIFFFALNSFADMAAFQLILLLSFHFCALVMYLFVCFYFICKAH